ncbi:MAG: hypothetical protein JW941_00790 [Candidatus Coatesbacteria bacterium]|nr:hypothetical protein [Candidatus Coatesbacteria bacterium]
MSEHISCERRVKLPCAIFVCLAAVGIAFSILSCRAIMDDKNAQMLKAVMSVHFVQGRNLLMVTTLNGIRSFQLDSDGITNEIDVAVEDNPRFSGISDFPEFNWLGKSSLFPMSLYAAAGFTGPSFKDDERILSEWPWLWTFDLDEMRLEPTIECEQAIYLSEVSVPISDYVTVFTCEPREIDLWFKANRLIPMELNLSNGLMAPIDLRFNSRIARPALIQVEDGYVTVETTEYGQGRLDESPQCYLSHNGVMISDDVGQILGVTPDMKRIFFSKYGLKRHPNDLRPVSLNSYDLVSKQVDELVSNLSGDKFRISRNSNRFGYLARRQLSSLAELASNGMPPFTSVRIHSLDGHSIEQFDLKEPIGTSHCDWEPDLGLIAYMKNGDLEVYSFRERN